MRVSVSQEALNSTHGKFEEMTGYPNEISIRQQDTNLKHRNNGRGLPFQFAP